MEMFSLCKDIGYLRNYFIFVGKNGEPYPEEKELEKRIETSIIKELLGCGYYLYVDNRYTIQLLFEHYTDTILLPPVRFGKIGKNIFTNSFKEKKLEKNEHDFRRNKNLLSAKFQDKKEILILSTTHTAEVVQTGKKIAVEKMFEN